LRLALAALPLLRLGGNAAGELAVDFLLMRAFNYHIIKKLICI